MQTKDQMKEFPTMMKAINSQLVKMKPEYFEGKYKYIEHLFNVDEMWEIYMSWKNSHLPPVLVQVQLVICLHSEQQYCVTKLLG